MQIIKKIVIFSVNYFSRWMYITSHNPKHQYCHLQLQIWSRKVHQRSEQDQTRVKSQSKDINLGGLLTTFFIMFLAFSHSTAINKMNTTPPKMLNQFPYNLRVCLVHGFVPVSATFILAAILFAQSKALRRAFIALSRSIYQESFARKVV